MYSYIVIEEGFIQKARQSVVVSVLWGKIVCRTGNIWSECAVLCTQLLYFSLYFVGGYIGQVDGSPARG